MSWLDDKVLNSEEVSAVLNGLHTDAEHGTEMREKYFRELTYRMFLTDDNGYELQESFVKGGDLKEMVDMFAKKGIAGLDIVILPFLYALNRDKPTTINSDAGHVVRLGNYTGSPQDNGKPTYRTEIHSGFLMLDYQENPGLVEKIISRLGDTVRAEKREWSGKNVVYLVPNSPGFTSDNPEELAQKLVASWKEIGDAITHATGMVFDSRIYSEIGKYTLLAKYEMNEMNEIEHDTSHGH